MVDWVATETRPIACVIEARDKAPANEKMRVQRFRALMRQRAPACMVVPIHNGTRGTGFPGLMVLHAGHVAFLRIENGTRVPDDDQVEWLNRLDAAGFPCGVFRTGERAVEWLAVEGFPVGGCE